MRRPLLAILTIAASALLATRGAEAGDRPTVPEPASPDYAVAANWACRPGAEAACTNGLDAVAVSPDGARAPQRFVAADAPAIDCFYVYPTASREPTDYADLAPTPEVIATIHAQAGRLASRCRVFAPLYRQATLAHLRAKMAGGDVPNWDMPYRDIVAAWTYYLAHDNHGRGVVLIAHSQGTIVLQRLIAEHIDGQPVQARLVSAFLAGDPALLVPAGARVGGTFKAIPLCSAAAETGCVYVWSSYLADDAVARRAFGRDGDDGLVAGCVNPAAPGGGVGRLKSYFPKPAIAPVADPAWVESVDQLTGACRADGQGDVLRVTVAPGRYADLLGPMLAHVVHGGWGLHTLDIALVQGNIVDVLGAEAAAWQTRRR
jgi:hypothetical protein